MIYIYVIVVVEGARSWCVFTWHAWELLLCVSECRAMYNACIYTAAVRKYHNKYSITYLPVYPSLSILNVAHRVNPEQLAVVRPWAQGST